MNSESYLTQEEVEKMEKPSLKFQCPIQANIYDIEFIYFKIRDCEDDQVLFEIRKPQEAIGKPISQGMRTIKYHFGPAFFDLKTIGTTLEFKVGGKPVKGFTMIERHYFKNQLIKSYAFTAPFCMPNSTNSMQAIYELPDLSPEKRQEMINCPWQTVSDSFYFVEGKMVLHTKALFNYAPFDE